MTLLFYAAVLLCAAGAVALVLRHDLYDREPLPAVGLTLLIGFLCTPLLGRLEDLVVYSVSSLPSNATIALTAGSVEELSRTLLVTLFALGDRKRFNDPMDGVVYGSLLGVGMAAFETVRYVGADTVFWEGTFPREVVRIYCHMILGGIAGYPVGALRMGYRTAPAAMILCPLVAVALHFLVDLGALEHATDPDGPAVGTAVVLGAVVTATLLNGGLTVIASERSRRTFSPGSPRRLVTWPLELILGRKDPALRRPARSGHGDGGQVTPNQR